MTCRTCILLIHTFIQLTLQEDSWLQAEYKPAEAVKSPLSAQVQFELPNLTLLTLAKAAN